jgi:hypothetical protein
MPRSTRKTIRVPDPDSADLGSAEQGGKGFTGLEANTSFGRSAILAP